MIIGISGKINSGKDTVGNIISYLTLDLQNTNIDFEEYVRRLPRLPNFRPNKFEIKKFADKLKDIVCLLLSCTREQLEDREFKEKELGEEWWCYKIWSKRNTTPFLINYLFKPNLSLFYDAELIKLTPRLLLQLLGTECGRQIIHPNIWVNALMSEYNDNNTFTALVILDAQDKSIKKIGKIKESNWIITDMRFPNEMEAVKKREGITIRVNRDLIIGEDDYGYTTVSVNQAEKDGIIKPQHESETALDNAKFDYVIDNNGTIEELIQKVKEILIKEKIIIP